MGAAISTEMRALNNLHVGRRDCPASAVGVNGWGPNVNLVRDPRLLACITQTFEAKK